MGFVWRWLFAFALLAATYNPTELNFISWATRNYATETPLTVLFALVLVVAYIVYLTATLRSIGALGMALVVALVAALVWVLVDRGLISLQNPSVNTWIGLFGMSLVLAIGMYWSILWRRLSGQLEVDDNDG
ncbi:DUF6524 family protein [Wenxinia marina]|uniref:Uncharacterized protein n=1 Tax=Wenxinia marina DSM 24838 TaxID=1123501 RepID=A0A0D0QBC1_9RHOB|nr:DUF6524 family protein [Wenxinia marina]KIQ68188.1 hypothetical protein Wenmar_03198 [Wenxinia marina DSM 24838]GGL76643.1 hypothetical protein GCM10011392_33820 [Wenxinia marina]